MRVHLLREGHVAAGVEAVDQLVALVAQVALHRIGRIVLVCHHVAAKALLERGLRAVRHHRHHPGRGEPVVRRVVRRVVAPLPLRVGVDGLSLRLAPPNLPGRVAAAHGDRHERPHERRAVVGRLEGPLEHVHAAHRPTDSAAHPPHAQLRQSAAMQAHRVADGEGREVGPVALACVGMCRRRRHGAVGRARHVQAHHEVLRGVECPPRTKKPAPPVGHIWGAGEGVAHEDGVGARRVERAPRLVGDGHFSERGAIFEGECWNREGLRHHRREMIAPAQAEETGGDA